jgi:hypothetical protein
MRAVQFLTGVVLQNSAPTIMHTASDFLRNKHSMLESEYDFHFCDFFFFLIFISIPFTYTSTHYISCFEI